MEKKKSLISGRSKHLHGGPSSRIHHQRKKTQFLKRRISKSNVRPDETFESNMDSITNSKIVTSSSYSPDLPSSSNYSCTNLPILSNYSQDLKCMSSYTTDLPSLPRYSTNLVPPPSLPYPSSTDLPSPHNRSFAQANHVEYLPHQHTCTDLTSSPGQSRGCSFSFSPVLKPQQNYGGAGERKGS